MKSKNLVINFILSFSLLLVFCGIPTKSLSQGNASESLKLARTYMIEGHYNEALLAINRSLTVEVSTEALSIKGNILQMLKQDEEAISVFNTAIERGDFKPSTYTLLGTSLQNQGKYYEAIYMYNKALALESSKIAYYNRGECKFEIGDKTGGCSDFITADDRGYSNAWFMNQDKCLSYLGSPYLKPLLENEKDELLSWFAKNRAAETSDMSKLSVKRMFVDQLLNKISEEQLKDKEIRELYNYINAELMYSICMDYAIKYSKQKNMDPALSLAKSAITYLRNGQADKEKVGFIFSWIGLSLIENDYAIIACGFFESAIQEGYTDDVDVYMFHCKN